MRMNKMMKVDVPVANEGLFKLSSGYRIDIPDDRKVNGSEGGVAISEIQSHSVTELEKVKKRMKMIRDHGPAVAYRYDYIRKGWNFGIHARKFKESPSEHTAMDLAECMIQFFRWTDLRGFKRHCEPFSKTVANRIKQALVDKDHGKIPDGISVCMIVKDEEIFLRECLESISGMYDELIIVDTGSSDSTVSIAKEFTEKVYSFIEDPFNFSNARKKSVEYATQEWIFIIDADERLEIDPGYNLKKLIRKYVMNEKDSGRLEFHDVQRGIRKKVGYSNVRIIRKNYVDFDGSVHNQITGFYDESSIHYEDRVRLVHVGYDIKTEKRKKRNTDQIEALRNAIYEMECNGKGSGAKWALNHYQLGRHYCVEGNYKKAIQAFNEAYVQGKDLGSNIRKGLVSMVAHAMVGCDVKKYDEYAILLTEYRKEFGNGMNPDLQFYLFRIADLNGMIREAVNHCKEYLKAWDIADREKDEVAYEQMGRRNEVVKYLNEKRKG